jgi:arylsulfatase A-like enzyme
MRSLLAMMIVLAGGTLSAAERKPNVIVIVADDLGYADIGVQGCKDVPTPHIDSLAKHGVRCSQGYVSGPYCSPTRAGLLTGRYQTRFGHEFNPGPRARPEVEAGLPLSETTMADRFKAAGYATGMVGKWHLGYEEKFHPLARGFSEYFGFLGGAHPYLPGQGGANRGILRGRETVDEKEYLTDAFTREAVAYIDRHATEPFFLYLTYNAVHSPMHASDKRLEKFAAIADEKRRTFATMLSAMDDGIGAVLKKLQDAGIEEKTLIFFVADNGGPTANNTSRNDPLRGFKATTWEGGVRVPWLVQWKGHLSAGKVYELPVIQLDILPTALAAAGIEPKEAKLDGVNLLPFLRGENAERPHETLYWRFGQQMAVRHGDYKLVRGNERDAGVRNQAQLQPHLFNLAADAGEQNDLAEKEPEKLKELQKLWDKWNAEQAKPLWGPPRAQAAATPR